ncbi:ubiquinol-cytochrome c reductase cytochrome c1 subunit [Sphingomonas naasensis]|uniref:Cytochrome c1 n=1 Tax=Sphingomonas naasensis TaxID=1344951 RepID=A0A4S1W4X3_9SPHN|nr:cytochrome c1 [Sphingomonas naasensis]NIJ19599.1 ubiquinol-cytochrome c reductase cytochrome c1 subunit [Sphingomonas naasensis]TGX37323.1 cytochrome c1 [Sphingomonas naasensis]
MLPLFIRSIKFLVGGAFIFVLGLALFGTISGWVQDPPKETAEEAMHHHPKELRLPSDGPLGKFDNQQLQRGFLVFEKVCASCHSLSLVSFRDLQQIGYSEAEVKKIAKDWPIKQPVQDPKAGTWGERDNLASDRFPKVYYPGTGTPPDLSLITKARHGGPAYVYSLLTGYSEKPSAEALAHFPEFAKTPDGMHFNPYFANLNIAMPPPLTADDQVTFSDGTRATVDQMAQDVSAFLVWTAEPTMQRRHAAGVAVVLFLLIATGLAYGAYLTVWRGVKH